MLLFIYRLDIGHWIGLFPHLLYHVSTPGLFFLFFLRCESNIFLCYLPPPKKKKKKVETIKKNWIEWVLYSTLSTICFGFSSLGHRIQVGSPLSLFTWRYPPHKKSRYKSNIFLVLKYHFSFSFFDTKISFFLYCLRVTFL